MVGRRLRSSWTIETSCGVRYETFDGKGGERWVCWYGQVFGETWKIKSVIIYSWRLCLRWNLRQIVRWTTKSGLLGTQDARFGLAADDPWMGVWGTKAAENGAGEALRGRRLGRIWSNKILVQLQCWWVAKCDFCADLLSGTLGRLGARRGSCSSSGLWTKGFKRS